MQIDDSHMPMPSCKSQEGNNNSDEEEEEEDWNLGFDSVESELMLSGLEIQYDCDSPRMNTDTVEAKIIELTRVADKPKSSKPYCGCGQYYSCTSSLYLHVRSKHNGVMPPGTIGGPKGIVKKRSQPGIFLDPIKVQECESEWKYVHRSIKQNNVEKLATIVQESTKPKFERKEQHPSTICKACGKIYSCSSSLNLHFKRKHQNMPSEINRTQSDIQAYDSMSRSFQCSICGLKYGSKSALGLHYNNKHNSNRTSNQAYGETDNGIQKCGCGLIYQSRSALNMHVKKKHGGMYPEGTSQKQELRGKPKGERQQRIQLQTISQKSETGKREHSRYEAEGLKRASEGGQKFDARESHCQKCTIELTNAQHFLCLSCDRHELCSNCFWAENNLKGGHDWQWIVRNPDH